MGFFDLLSSAMQSGQTGSFYQTRSDLDRNGSPSSLERILMNDNPNDIPHGKEAAYSLLLENDNDYFNNDYLSGINVHIGDDDSVYSLYERIIERRIEHITQSVNESELRHYCLRLVRLFVDEREGSSAVDAIAAFKILADSGMKWTEASEIGFREITHLINGSKMPILSDAIDTMRQNC